MASNGYAERGTIVAVLALNLVPAEQIFRRVIAWSVNIGQFTELLNPAR